MKQISTLNILISICLGSPFSMSSMGCETSDGDDSDNSDRNRRGDANADADTDSDTDNDIDSDADADDDLPSNIEPVATTEMAQYGEWTYYEVEGAVCRSGKPAGYYFRKGNDNLVIFLNGGGVCSDDFLCAMNPADVDHSLPGETVVTATGGLISNMLVAQRQVPPDEGIFAKDDRNPLKEWSMVYVPYCTGDVHGGTNPNASPGSLQDQRFVGYTNLGLFYRSFGASYGTDFRSGSEIVLCGSSAGSFGALLNYDRTQQFFADSHITVIADSGMIFRDDYLEPCLQKRWRELFNLDDILPRDCAECFHDDGGGLLEGFGNYLYREKYPNRMVGGGISSAQDDIMKLFLSTGLNDCTTGSLVASVGGFLQMSPYPPERYPAGMTDAMEFLGVDRFGTYFMTGNKHQYLFRARYYEENDTGMTIAEWIGEFLNGNPVHMGSF